MQSPLLRSPIQLNLPPTPMLHLTLQKDLETENASIAAEMSAASQRAASLQAELKAISRKLAKSEDLERRYGEAKREIEQLRAQVCCALLLIEPVQCSEQNCR